MQNIIKRNYLENSLFVNISLVLFEVQFRFEDLTANVTLRGLDVARAVTERRVSFEVTLMTSHLKV